MQILIHIGKGGDFKERDMNMNSSSVTTSTPQIFLSMPLFIGYKNIFIPQSEYESPGKHCLNEYFYPDLPSLFCPIFAFSSVQSLSRVQLFATPWTTACQASLSIASTKSLLKLMSHNNYY